MNAAVAAPPVWRRLTTAQYHHVVDDLLGPGLQFLSVEGEPAIGGLPSVGAAQVATSPLGVEQYEATAASLASQAVKDPARRARLVACTPTGAADETCARQLVVQFGRLAFRRPLVDAEVSRYLALWRTAASAGKDFWAGVEPVVGAFLQSPKFLYRLEYAPAAGAAGQARRLDGYALAGRLSFLVWDSTPDAALLDAAARGDLDRADGVRAQVTRLLSSPRARTGLRDFFADLMQMGDFGVSADRAGAVPPAIAAAMREETLRTFEDAAFDADGDLLELLRSPGTFVGKDLAKFYKLPAPAGTTPARVAYPMDGPRRGLLGQGAFLVPRAEGTRSSPVERGKFVREALLCQGVPPPPPGAADMAPAIDPAKPSTARQRLMVHRKDPTCGACHALLDPLGLPFEVFDGAAQVRDAEQGIHIDPSGDLGGVAFADARGLADLLAASPDVTACFVRTLYRQALGRVEGAAEQRALDAVVASFQASGRRLSGLVPALATSDLFAQVSP